MDGGSSFLSGWKKDNLRPPPWGGAWVFPYFLGMGEFFFFFSFVLGGWGAFFFFAIFFFLGGLGRRGVEPGGPKRAGF